MTGKNWGKLTIQDLSEILVGAAAIAFPVAMADETWNLSSELSWQRMLALLVLSLAILGWYGFHLHHGSDLRQNWPRIVGRVVAVYVLTAGLSSLMLLLLDKWPLFSEPLVAIRRTVIVSFPAVFSATIVDNLGDLAQGRA